MTMRSGAVLPLLLAAASVVFSSCHGLEAPEGLWQTRETGGPVVVFDLFARPLPEVPFPIDVAARPDAGARTGLRVNASAQAATDVESDIRRRLDQVDGWDAYGPISVSFEPTDQHLDIGNVLRRQAGDDFDFSDDAVYVVNLDPDSPRFGMPVPLELGEGSLPQNLHRTGNYWDNDPRSETPCLHFETTYEDTNGNGRLDLCEDRDHDGEPDPGEDLDGDGVVFDAEPDLDRDGVLDPEEDVNGNGRRDCSEDTDFDGHLDIPNLYCGDEAPGRPIPPWECPDLTFDSPGGEVVVPAADAWLLDWYELETNTLILRPLIPLDEETTYAVLLTSRLVDQEGRAVTSPFPTTHHADQAAPLRALPDALAAHPETFGGLGVDDVQFAWTFTTQSITADMRDIREGLHGRGPAAALADEFPPEVLVDLLHGCQEGVDCELPENRYIIRARGEGGERGLFDILEDLMDEVEMNFDIDQEMIDHVVVPFGYVDYLVHFRYPSPDFLETDGRGEDVDGDGRLDLVDEDLNGNGELDPGEDLDFDGHLDSNEDLDGDRVLDGVEDRFDLDIPAGRLPHGRHLVTAIATIPKADPERGIEPPFPVVIYSNGYGMFRLESLIISAHLAKYGIATIGVDDVRHGLEVDPLIEELIRSIMAGEDLAPMAEAILTDRALDLDGNGTDDSGGNFISAYVFRMRDMVRQTVVDLMRLVQILRSFDGESLGLRDVDGDGEVEVAGDWNADGVPDVGGPDVDLFSMGTSLGAIVTTVFAGLEPDLVATAPISGGGGLVEIGARTALGGVRAPVVLRMMSPLLVTEEARGDYELLPCGAGEDCPSGSCVGGVCRCASDRDCRGEPGFRCHGPSTDLAEGGDVCAVQGDTACAMDQVSVRFIAPLVKDDVPVEVACLDDDVVDAGDTLVLRNGDNGETGCFVAWPGHRSRLSVAADEGDPLELAVYEGEVLVDDAACEVREDATLRRRVETFEVDATFAQQQWLAGEPLVSPVEGFGLRRATPSLRRFISIAQIAVDPADPANMARHHFLDPVDYGERTGRTASMIVTTSGDDAVPTAFGVAIARSAGIVDLFRRDPRLADEDHPDGRTPNRYLIDTGAIMGVDRLAPYRRASDGRQVIFDPDDLDRSGSPPFEGWTGDGFGEPAPEVPLRLWRPLNDGETCTCRDASGEHPCTWPGETVGPLEMVRCPGGVATLVMAYMDPEGSHAIIPDPGRGFDVDVFFGNMAGLYFQSRGTELHWDVCMEDSSCTVEENGFFTPPNR